MAEKSKKRFDGKQENMSFDKTNAYFIAGFVVIVLGLLLALAIGSFLYSGGADRSIFDVSLWDLFFPEEDNAKITAVNMLGKMGAWVSDMLVTNGVGLMAFVVPVFLVAIGLRLLEVKSFSLKKLFMHGVLISIWGSVVLGFVFFGISDKYYPLLGGMHGYYVSKWLMSSIGVVGTFALLFVVTIIYMSVYISGFQEKVRKLISLISNHKINMPKVNLDMTDGDRFLNTDTEVADEERKSDVVSQPQKVKDEEIGEFEEDTLIDEEPPLFADEPVMEESGNEAPVFVDNQDLTFAVDRPQNQDEETGENYGSLDTPYDPTMDLSHYEYPPFDLLVDYKNEDTDVDEETRELREKKDKIVETLDNFGIKIQQIKATIGPTVTLYEIVPAPGVRISKIQGLQDDIALSLAALGIRIIAPMPGKGTIGIEVPNSKPQVVSMLSMVKSKKFQESTYELPIVMGKTISNEVFMFDLTKTPHLLVAGATGMGKSVGLNAIVTSILYKKHPSQVKFVMVDPKMVEFSVYRKLENHFMAKMASEENVIITDVDRVKATLNSLAVEMDDRYALLQKVDMRNIKEYNKMFIDRKLNPEHGHRYLPYIVVIIDEFADLIMTAGKEIETPIARIAQKARAVGIHMILATQRPSAKIITGVIKANFPTQIAFRVGSMVDSRTIIDTTGAQHLIGRGDMLVKMGSDTTRVQCALVDTPEVIKINEFIGSQQGYMSAYPLPEVAVEGDEMSMEEMKPGELDAMFADVARMVVEMQSGSTSNIQRRFSLGYNRAGRIMDQLERAGIVGPAEGSKPRALLVSSLTELESILERFGVS